MTIDSHVHFWKYNKQRDTWITSDMKILRQNYFPEQLLPTLERNGISGCVAIQASQEIVETRFLSELSQTHPFIKGVVGWVDLLADNVEAQLEELSVYPNIKGYRHVVQAEAPGFMLQPAFQRGIAALQAHGYTYDILIYPPQLQEANELVSKFPGQHFVIDHCAKPNIAGKQLDDWKAGIKEIAGHPNVYCKLSGLFTEADWKSWSASDFYPYLDVLFETFGIDRLLFGSDWPVMLLSGIYVQWKSLLEKYLENQDAEEKAKIFGGNATLFYNL